ncbi:HAMP domain-containing histidine kinase [Enterovibrio norvegicus]|uniref:sensor histidine kinase n=1 Tax=Enterovibrio norvegicus TaxID=188144 RepID=UPI0010BF299D|nr:HAMP domain-containing sensor histidine kinase [Enterovibrio norvegicus]TKF11501.1 HAMP domain-containing histidine kinase [Enterovibrio norvegicus]
MTFKNRLLFFTLIWFVGSAAVLTKLSVDVWEGNELKTQQYLHRDLARHMRDDNPLMVGDDYSPAALSSIFHTLMLLGPDFEIYFLDPEGNITTSGPPLDDVQRQHVSVEPIKAFLAEEPLPILGQDPMTEDRDMVFSAAQITDNGIVAGYLYVVIGSQQRNAVTHPDNFLQYAPIVLAALVAISLFAVGVYRMVFKRIIIPGRNMVRQIEDAATSEFRITPPLALTSYELQELAEQCRRMMGVIQQQFIQLRIQEAQRREYLLQLSHDLKTPLANTLGYIETWRLQHKEGRGMIDTAYHNAQRLDRYLKDQLAAARSPTAKIVLAYRELDVETLLEEVKARFELPLKKKKVDLVISSAPDLFVVADEQLINRVFDNLIENAIRHSPHRSSILLDVSKTSACKVEFTFINTVAKNGDSGSLGMGTKIVEAILSLHQTHLEICDGKAKEGSDGGEERYCVNFALSSIAPPSARPPLLLPEMIEEIDEAPVIVSDYPTMSAAGKGDITKETEDQEHVAFSSLLATSTNPDSKDALEQALEDLPPMSASVTGGDVLNESLDVDAERAEKGRSPDPDAP